MDKAGAGEVRMGELGRGLVEPARAFGRNPLRGDNGDVYGVTLERRGPEEQVPSPSVAKILL